ncbi:hypothetical protein BDR06DRAFT_427448 [Suillus hirtellus]|nr:hypothetical protein BDR06DRAFT_427448 [Suillus hirtellus]
MYTWCAVVLFCGMNKSASMMSLQTGDASQGSPSVITSRYFESTWLASITTFIFSIYATGQYSLILKINQPAGHYWMHTDQNLGTKSAAILGYAGSCDVDPEIRTIPDSVTLNKTDLHPLYPPPLLIKEDGVDIKFHLILEKNETNFSFHINGVQCTSNSVPVVLQLLGGDMTGSNLVPNDSYTLFCGTKFLER